ncbi:uncharacterized protein LOC126905253 [Daktulosphaira vitifoliae]|uniref:uncharacterized protein LOC126905253 n=1 Tax=Daktulosphaira vitifoliae TaxID=58002 RepID=UPI0021AB0434|nr:uncharacterized protein LOC126905253 [Daktulosphaira vitifoliae]
MTECKNLDGIFNVGSVLNSNKSDDIVNVQTNFNRFSSYSSLTESNSKYRTYKPIEWTLQSIMSLIYSTNYGRFILTDAKVNHEHLSNDAQNTLTRLNKLFI